MFSVYENIFYNTQKKVNDGSSDSMHTAWLYESSYIIGARMLYIKQE